MSDPICVCGHKESEHCDRPSKVMRDFTGKPFEEHRCHCGCESYRPSLPWPDSEGWWWCDKLGLVEVKRSGFSNLLWLEGYGEHGFEDGFEHHPAGFVKLAEQNPFEQFEKGT